MSKPWHRDVPKRVTKYLGDGGLWNPELMDHEAVRSILIDARDVIEIIARERASAPETSPEYVMKASEEQVMFDAVLKRAKETCELCHGTKETHPAGSFEAKPCPMCTKAETRTAPEPPEKTWDCVICGRSNYVTSPHCAFCDYSRMVMREGVLVLRDGR